MIGIKRILLVIAVVIGGVFGFTGAASANPAPSTSSDLQGDMGQMLSAAYYQIAGEGELLIEPDPTACDNHPYFNWCFELCSWGQDTPYCNLTVEEEPSVCDNHPYFNWCFELCSWGQDTPYCNLTVEEEPVKDGEIVCDSGTWCFSICPNGIYFPRLEFCMDEGSPPYYRK